MSKKIGIMIPTTSRPDFLRASVLQWAVQSVKPDIICVFQNNNAESYEWCVEDLKPLINIKWIHTGLEVVQHFWYLLPLKFLLEYNCDYFFWGDHDDIYRIDHVEKCVDELQTCDATIAQSSGVLFVQTDKYKYKKPDRFLAHAPGGMTSSMAFNREFAMQLSKDIEHDLIRKKYYYTDNVVAFDTMPNFRVTMSPRITTTYVCHDGSHSSNAWLNAEFNK